MSAWIFHCLWNPWQRALPLCGSFLKKAQTNSARPPRGVQIRDGIHCWSRNSHTRWLVSSSRCFLSVGEATDLSKKPRPACPQLLLLLWENTKAELDGEFNSSAMSKVWPGVTLGQQNLGPPRTSPLLLVRNPQGPRPLWFLLQVADCYQHRGFLCIWLLHWLSSHANVLQRMCGLINI